MSDIAGPVKDLDLGTRIPRALVPTQAGPHTGAPMREFGNGRVVKVRPKHRLVIALAMAGWKNNEIARHLGYSSSRVCNILQSHNPEILAIKAELQDKITNNVLDVNSTIRLAAPRAIVKMIELMEHPDPQVARLSAKDILDRAGFTPVKKQVNLEGNIPIEQMGQVLGRINSANEVVLRQSEWEIKEGKVKQTA